MLVKLDVFDRNGERFNILKATGGGLFDTQVPRRGAQ